MAWYDDIEEEIIIREQWQEYATTISSFEEMILDLEKEALTYTKSNGFQPCMQRKTIVDMYFTEAGTKKYTETIINTQNKKWVLNYIQRQLTHKRMFSTQSDIAGYLHDISTAYHAAEMQRKEVKVQVSASLRHRLRQIA